MVKTVGEPLGIYQSIWTPNHIQVFGRTQMGKSTFLRWFIRKLIFRKWGFACIDIQRPLYRAILEDLTNLDYPAIPVSLSDTTTARFNPFHYRGGDPAAFSDRLLLAVTTIFGEDLKKMPFFRQYGALLIRHIADSGDTLPEALRLFAIHDKAAISRAMKKCSDPILKAQWTSLGNMSDREFRAAVIAPEDRFTALSTAAPIKRHLENGPGIELFKAIESRRVLLFDYAPDNSSGQFQSQIMASITLSEFFDAGLRRAQAYKRRPYPPFYLILDEAQAYASGNLAAMLDQLLKAGLYVLFVHHHLQQFRDFWLRDSIRTNAGTKIIFGGLQAEDAVYWGPQIDVPAKNLRELPPHQFYLVVNGTAKLCEVPFVRSPSISDARVAEYIRSVCPPEVPSKPRRTDDD